MKQLKLKDSNQIVRLCFIAYGLLFLFAGVLLVTPPGKLPYLGVLASLLVFPILRGNKIARISAIGLLVVTIFLTKKEVEDGRKYQRRTQEVGKSID